MACASLAKPRLPVVRYGCSYTSLPYFRKKIEIMRVPTNFNDFIYKDTNGNHWLRFWKCFFSSIALKEERNNCMIPPFISNMEGARFPPRPNESFQFLRSETYRRTLPHSVKHNATILQNQKLSLSEIAETLSISKSKAFRLLKK
ncbi:MAG: hypothetical protein K2M10_09590 [Muribaculaceae bacterium]|nr:hypothetical protein [Muribaculaceae bacterium]